MPNAECRMPNAECRQTLPGVDFEITGLTQSKKPILGNSPSKKLSI
jgi:hypothetical protein